MFTFIISIVLGVIVIIAGSSLIVGLSEPLASIKDLFIALVELITSNAIWFILVLLLFVVVFQVFRKIKINNPSAKDRKQQKIDNEYRERQFKAQQRQRRIDNANQKRMLDQRDYQLQIEDYKLSLNKRSNKTRGGRY